MGIIQQSCRQTECQIDRQAVSLCSDPFVQLSCYCDLYLMVEKFHVIFTQISNARCYGSIKSVVQIGVAIITSLSNGVDHEQASVQLRWAYHVGSSVTSGCSSFRC